jgi:hypothetical protein
VKKPNQVTIDAIKETKEGWEISITFSDSKAFLKAMAADDDFLEHLEENCFDSIDMDELCIVYADWAKENFL